jgi:murein DD-endopeptidase MepM/ murein hydrolase activator NlpD
MMIRVLTLLIVLFAAPAFALELALPVACSVGADCWVQQYADHDAGVGSTDYTCGVASYDKHDGTDIRVLNTRVDVAVLAAAAGRVRAVRDGVADRLVKSAADVAAVAKIECGNGMVITHGDGWETQYCHMRKGSVLVKAGDQVAAGDRLGLIGFSGEAAFPHVHVTVRKDSKVVDPFSADDMTDCKARDRSLWSASAQKALAYKGSELLQLAWAPRIYDDDEVESGRLSEFQPTDWPALVLFAEAINLYKDDVMTLTVSLPGQEPVVNSIAMKNNRAVQRLYAGKKTRGSLRNGIYVGRFELRRGDVVVLAKEINFEMKD